MISIPTGPSDLPDPRALNSAQAGSGRAVAALYHALLQGLGFDQLRAFTMPIQVGDWHLDRGIPTPAAATQYLRITPSPLAQYLWAGVVYTREVNLVYAPSMSLSIEKAAGGVVDPGITWGRELVAADALGVKANEDGSGRFVSTGAMVGVELVAHTGWTVGSGLAPRLLNLGPHQGDDLVLRLDVANVRPYTLMCVEAYRSAI